MALLQWIGEPTSAGGVTECRFHLERESGIVPGILWTPTHHDRPLPLVLIGHGASSHKRGDEPLMLGRRFAGISQIAAMAIDGPRPRPSGGSAAKMIAGMPRPPRPSTVRQASPARAA